MSGVRHLYVHVPFCAHRCGYCDFVTVVGRVGQHRAYVEAVVAELALERARLASPLETVYLGGGTPTFTDPEALALLLASLPRARELTVEANPETVTPALARLLREAGVNRVSLGVQSFERRLLATLERRAGAEDVRRAVRTLRAAGLDNISLDLLYGVPGQSAADLDADIDEALSLQPEHLSVYELEAKAGTRFAHAHGRALEQQAEAMEGYFEQVVERLTAAGYRWYETASFCLPPDRGRGRDLRARHNLAYWRGRDYLGLGIGAVSTVAGRRWRNAPRLASYLRALAAGSPPPREVEVLDEPTRARERLMLGLRLDEPVSVRGLESAIDERRLAQLEALGLAERTRAGLTLSPRGRRLGGGVTAAILA